MLGFFRRRLVVGASSKEKTPDSGKLKAVPRLTHPATTGSQNVVFNIENLFQEANGSDGWDNYVNVQGLVTYQGTNNSAPGPSCDYAATYTNPGGGSEAYANLSWLAQFP